MIIINIIMVTNLLITIIVLMTGITQKGCAVTVCVNICDNMGKSRKHFFIIINVIVNHHTHYHQNYTHHHQNYKHYHHEQQSCGEAFEITWPSGKSHKHFQFDFYHLLPPPPPLCGFRQKTNL